jgi:NADPH:quinone reductase-like Zn-dependent oxidoreductase
MVGLDRLAWQSYEKSSLGKNLGIECSGEVVAVGPDVTSCKVGDKVMATTGGTIGTKYLTIASSTN